MSKASILIVEDEPVVARDLQRTLERSGFTVPAVAASGEDALRRAEETHPDMALMDIVLHGPMDGIEGTKWLMKEVLAAL